jgi:hypothetical protein
VINICYAVCDKFINECVCVCVCVSLTLFSYLGIWLQVEWPSFVTYGTVCLYVVVIKYIMWNKNVVVFLVCVHPLCFTWRLVQKVFVCYDSLRSVLRILNLSYIMYLTKHIMENNVLCIMIYVLLISYVSSRVTVALFSWLPCNMPSRRGGLKFSSTHTRSQC